MTLMDYYPPQLRSLVENNKRIRENNKRLVDQGVQVVDLEWTGWAHVRTLKCLFKASWEAHVIRGDKTMRYGDDSLTWAPRNGREGLFWSHRGEEVDWTVKDVHASYETEMSNLLEEMSKNIN